MMHSIGQFKLPLAAPPWTKLGKTLESATRKACFEFELLDGVSHLSIALSGGKDSLTLLFLLNAIRGRGFPFFEISALHVTGDYSCGAGVDPSFLRAICQRLEVHFYTLEQKQNPDTLECYSCSRERRRLIFEKAKELDATTIAFGHHRDDHAQTLLLNLLHKGEFAGLLPKLKMVDYDVTIVRPLFYLPEERILSFAKEHGFARITCQCPIGQRSMRKKVEQQIQNLEALFPHARSNIAHAGLMYGSTKARRNEPSKEGSQQP